MATRLEDALAARLRQLARAKKIPLSHVADRAGLARSYFWSLLNSSNSATLAVIQRLAEALAVEPLELLAGTDAEPIENDPEPPTAVVAVKTAPRRVAADAKRAKAIKTASAAPATPPRTRKR